MIPAIRSPCTVRSGDQRFSNFFVDSSSSRATIFWIWGLHLHMPTVGNDSSLEQSPTCTFAAMAAGDMEITWGMKYFHNEAPKADGINVLL